MSKPRAPWWSYVKTVVRRYPGTPEREAIAAAINEFSGKPDILHFVDLLYWKRSCSMYGAAEICHISYATARNWNRAFLKCVAHHMGLPE